MFLAHATGLCAGTWDPACDLLGNRHLVRWDAMGHGRSTSPRSGPVSWWEMGADAASVIDGSSGIGVGHSMGGTSLVMSQLARATLDALVLFEPVILPGPYLPDPNHGHAVGARRRRDAFGSRDEVRARYRSRPPFDSWHPDAFEGYVRCGFREDVEGVVLACRRDHEAAVFAATPAHTVLERVGEIRMPVVIVVGSETDIYESGWASELASRFQHAELVEVDGSHFVPMEHPDLVADLVGQVS